MAPKQPCAKYQYVVTPAGPKILPVDEPSCKDEESPADYNAGGYLPVKVGDVFKHGRYRVIRKLGWGHFSTVWLVKDTQTHSHSALKVVKSAGRYAETARDEIKLLSQVSSFAPTHPGRSHIVSFLDSFSHQGPEASHICIVFEPLGENLLALIERNKKKGVPRPLVKVIAKQILLGLQYLHDECDLVHTDIKPENILISIPDIEAHIHNELSQSPSPTSRRVGVPLPTKSRAGVSIPSNQQRARRQVQIFHSQPLASPGRSGGRSAHGHTSLSMSTRLEDSGSGRNSQNNSFIAQMHLSRMAAAGATSVNHVTGTTASLSSSAPKVSSALSQSAPLFPPKPTETGSSGKVAVNSPSTSSSSSSISSAVASGAGSSSIISTPPTSLSHSFSNLRAAGFLGMKSTNIEIELRSRPNLFSMSGEEKEFEQEREGLPMKGSKGKNKMTPLQNELDAALSTSWRDRLSPTLASSYQSTSSSHNLSKLRNQVGNRHSRSHSGAGFWKDPGTGAPAPAVLVSAVARADEEAGDLFPQPTVVGAGKVGKSTFEISSATVTVRPSPTITPPPDPKTSTTTTLINGVNKMIAENTLSTNETHASASFETPFNPSNLSRSLLTQTAPSKVKVPTVSPLKRNIIRNSPPQQVSQLSAHMHMHCPPPQSSCSDAMHNDTNTTRANKSSRSSRVNPSPPAMPPILPTSVTPTPTSPTPAVPPPTPIASPIVNSVLPYSASATASAPDGLPSLLPIQTPSEAAVERPPPISVKIADLGNATPSTKHYTEDIQTRQYRAPEAIVGRRDWDARADVWSVACVIFELLTAEYLFDPQGQGELFTKDDDHMAQIIELLGDFPLEAKMGGKYSRELFDHTGALRYIRTLKPWPLKRVMMEKYLFTEVDAAALCSFLEPMLAVDMRERVHARDMIEHSWLTLHREDEAIME